MRSCLHSTNDCFDMKALSLTQPWAELVVLGEKQWETRSWRTSHRGRIAIHAAKKFPAWAIDLAQGNRYFVDAIKNYPVIKMPLGMIVGTVEVVAMQSTDAMLDVLGHKEIAFGDYDSERWAWQLAEPDMLAEPIPCRGALGLWEVPPDVLGQITIDSIERMLFL